MSDKKSNWVLFWDMHSGGYSKEKWDKIYIEASDDEAHRIFSNRFGHEPYDIACECCGCNYAVYDEEPSLEQASGYHRNCLFDKDKDMYVEKHSGRSFNGNYMTVEEYEKMDNVLVIRAEDIKANERGE